MDKHEQPNTNRPYFHNVEQFYSFMSQANSFAPRFKDLKISVQQEWQKDFEKYRSQQRTIK